MTSIAPKVALIAAAATLLLAQPVFAQTPASTTAKSASSSAALVRPDPLDTNAAVLPLVYRSMFEGYRPNAEAALGAWKDANDNVGRVGGWRVYARQARQPEAPEAATAADIPASGAATQPAAMPPAGHTGHKTN